MYIFMFILHGSVADLFLAVAIPRPGPQGPRPDSALAESELECSECHLAPAMAGCAGWPWPTSATKNGLFLDLHSAINHPYFMVYTNYPSV